MQRMAKVGFVSLTVLGSAYVIAAHGFDAVVKQTIEQSKFARTAPIASPARNRALPIIAAIGF